MAPGTIADLFAGARRAGGAAQPPAHLVLVSAAGDVFEGAEATGAATDSVERALSGLAATRVEPANEAVLDAADDQGAEFSELFLDRQLRRARRGAPARQHLRHAGGGAEA